MARKEVKVGKKNETADFDFEKDFDFDFGDVNSDNVPKPTKKRSAVTDVARGTIRGATSEITSPSFFKSLIKKSLPREYGNAMDFVDQSVGTMRDTYNEAARQAKPAINQIKRTTGKILPSVREKMPKGLAEKLDLWTKSADDGRRNDLSAEQQRDSALSMTLAGIFEEQAKAEVQTKSETNAKSVLKDALTNQRHDDSMGQLDAIRLNTQRLSDYQDKITSKFQRQSLEMQYRHYFVATDSLAEAKKLGVTVTANLEAITKNTALPEIQKIKKSETFKEHVRNRLTGGALDTISGARKEFMGKLIKNAGNAMKDKVSEFTDAFSQGLEMVEQAQDAMNMAKEMGADVSGADMAGDMIGASMISKLGSMAGKYARKHTSKMTNVHKGAAHIGYGLGNKEQLIKEWAKGDKGDDIPVFGSIIRAFKDLVPSLKTGMSVETDTAMGVNDPAIFTNATRKSITEIIPGYLARIYQELQIMRTGDQSIDLLAYDHSSNAFSSKGELKTKMFRKLINKDDVKRTKQDGMHLVNLIDPENTLTTKERMVLAKRLIAGNINGELANPVDFASTANYGGIDKKHKEKFAKLFETQFGIKKNAETGKMSMGDSIEHLEKRTKFSQHFNELGTAYRGVNEGIQMEINAGNYEALREMGFLKEDNTVDQAQIEKFYQGTMPKAKSTAKAGLVNSMKQHQQSGLQPAASTMGNDNTIPGLDDEWKEEISNGQQDIIAAIKANRTVDINQSIRDQMDKMTEMLGYIAVGSAGGISQDQLPLMQRSIGSLLSGGAKGAMSMGRKVFDLGKRAVTAQFKAIGWAGGKLSKGLGIAKEWLSEKKEAADLYFKDELEPRIIAWKLEAGEYFDAVTKEPIKKLSDIKGAVVDKYGEFVVRADEWKQLRLPEAKSRMMGILKGLKDGAVKLGGKLFEGSKSAHAFVLKHSIGAAKWIHAKLRQGEDVYVGDEKEPRLIAFIMSKGGYFSALTGKPIFIGKDIDGPIKNSEGKFVLTEDDFRKGIHDAEGKPFKGRFVKALEFGKKQFLRAKNIVTNFAGKVLDVAKGGWEAIMGKVVGKDGIVLAGGKKLRTLVEEIRDILKDRLPKRKKVIGDIDGDGVREGSWQDKERKAKEAAGEGGSFLDRARTKASGIGAAAMAGLAKLFGKGKKKDGEGEDKGDGKGWIDSTIETGMDALDSYTDYKMLRGLKGGKAAEVVGDLAGKTKAGRLVRAANWLGKGVGTAQRWASKVPGAGTISKYGRTAWDAGKGFLGKGAAKVGLGAAGAAGTAGVAGAGALGAGTTAAGLGAGATAAGTAGAIGTGGAGLAGLGAGGAALGTAGEVAGTVAKASKWGGALKGMGLGAGALATDYAADKVGRDTRIGANLAVGSSALEGAGYGAMAGSFVPVVGTAVGALIGGTIGAGIGIYKNWDKIKIKSSDLFGEQASIGNYFLGRRPPGTVGNIRMAQYGFLPTEKDKIDGMRKFENVLMDSVKMVNGVMNISNKDVDPKKLFPIFNLNPENKSDLTRFAQWFQNRFRPVYKKHMEALAAINSKAAIETVDDDLKDEEKAKYIAAIAMPDSIYGITESPFSADEKLKAGASEVQTVIDSAKKKIKDGDKGSAKALVAGAAIAGASTLQPASPDAQGGGKTDGENLTNAFKNLESPTKPLTPAQAAKATVTGAVLDFGDAVARSMSSLDAVKYKTYGLVNFELEKIRALVNLERAVSRDIVFDSKGAATWSASLDNLAKSVGPMFGFADLRCRAGGYFVQWFSGRFLPTYLAMASAVKSITSKDKVDVGIAALTPEQAVNVAMAVYTAKDGSDAPVWNCTVSPWPNYTLNTDRTSVDKTLVVMKSTASPTVVPEKSTMVDKRTDDQLKNARTDAAAQAAAKPENSFATSFANSAKNLWQGAKDAASGAWTATKNVASDAWYGAKEMLGTGNRSPMGSGPGVTSGAGAGGKVDELPLPRGSGSYAALKELIDAAAKAVGVDPQLMATMAAIESGFNPNAKAKFGSAAGLYQFINSTWQETVKKHGSKYGITSSTSSFDPRANALMGAEFLKGNINYLKNKLGRDPNQTDMYLAHFMGPAGAAKFLKSDHDDLAANVFPREAANNRDIFAPGGRPVTIGQMYDNMSKLLSDRARQFKIGIAPVAGMPVKTTGASETAANGAASTTAPGITPSPNKSVSKLTSSLSGAPSAAQPGYAGSTEVQSGPTTTPTEQAKIVKTSTTANPAIPEMSSGFSQATRTTTAQMAERSGAESSVIGSVDDTLKKSLDVQKQQLDMLSKIYLVIGKNGGMMAQAPIVAPAETSSSSVPNIPQQDRSARKMPVSMKKSA